MGVDRRTLFTYDAFDGVEQMPLPGPLYVHAEGCERYPEDGVFPKDMLSRALTLNAYSRERRFVAREYAEGDRIEPAIDRLLSEPGADYIQVHDTETGCYDFRIVPA